MPATIFERAASWLKTRLDYEAAVLVDYVTSGGTITDLEAVPGGTEFETANLDDAVTTHKSRDWTIRQSDLVLSAVQLTPAKGHAIHYTLADGTVEKYAVLPLGDDRYHASLDHLGTLWRIHTKLKEITAP